MTERKPPAQARLDGERMFHLLMENVKDFAIFMLDPEGRIVSWNTGAERILGYKEPEIIGQPFAVIFTPEDVGRKRPEYELQTARETGRAEDERWHVRKDGSRFWASGVVTPLLDEGGELQGFAKTLRDITERKRSEEQLAAVSMTIVATHKDKVGVPAKKSTKLLDSLKIDPDLEKLLPPTSAQEDKAHKKAIQKEGVIHPLIADEEGVLIDGIRTYKVCRELNIRDVWVVTLPGLTDEEKRHKRLALNVNRRQLTRKQKRELLRQELLRNPAISSGHLARIVGCSHNTVQKVREEMIANGQIDRCPIEASDGRVFKASGILTPLHGVRRTQAHLADPSNHVDNGKILPFQKWKSQVIEKQRSRMADLGASLPQEQECRIHCCRFQDLLTVDPSIKGEAALVLTDIPWTASFLPELDDFARTTKDVLKPGGILVCYSGVMHLFDLGASLGKHLTYVWTITQTHPTSIHCETGGVKRGSLSVYDKWRPIVVFVNGPMPSMRESALQDWIQGQGSQKDLHDWQQSLEEVKFYVTTFTGQGDLTVDLCGGSFTTAHAAKELGRRFVGCDVDEKCVSLGKYRISQVSPQSSLSA